jgi:hypothetical protein
MSEHVIRDLEEGGDIEVEWHETDLSIFWPNEIGQRAHKIMSAPNARRLAEALIKACDEQRDYHARLVEQHWDEDQ